jgi:copper chaperone NosL
MSRWLPWILVAIVLAVVAFVAKTVLSAGTPPDGPVAAVWDREACAFCRMHLGEPAFAAQLHTRDGRVLFFDDPGCVFELLDAEPLDVHAIWFRDHREDRWLARDGVAFAAVEPTPMGYGLAAVPAGTPGALSVEQAHAKVRAMRKAR